MKMTRLRTVPWFPLLALPTGVVLLQHHGIAYWTAALAADGWGWGVATSLTLGLFELWAWWEYQRAEVAGGVWAQVLSARAGWFLFAGLTTALLIAAPLYDVGRPLFAGAAREALVADRQDQLELEFDRYSKLADKRVGWAARLDRTTAEQTRHFEARLAALGGAAPLAWQKRFMLAGHGLALCLAVVAVVAGIRALAGWRGQYEEAGDGTMGRSEEVVEAGCGESIAESADAAGVVGTGGLEFLGRVEGPVVAPENGNGKGKTEGEAGGKDGDRTDGLRTLAVSGAGGGVALSDLRLPTGDGAAAATRPHQDRGAEALTVPPSNAVKWTERFARVQRVRAALAVRFPGMAPGQIARLAAPTLEVELSRLGNFERDVEWVRARKPGAKVIGPAELAALERLAGVAA